MKHNNKKAFTIIELVIVIAVIGILAAILIPTFMSLTSRSKQVATEALITNLNKIMMIKEVESTSSTNITLGDALEKVSKDGYTALGIANNDTLILWDQKTNRFIKEEDIPNNRNKYEYWCFSSTPSETYSTYLLETSANNVNTSLGIDVGDNSNININFSNPTTLDDLRIKTNKGNLSISSNSDSKIYQYGSSDDIEMNTGKLYLYGDVDTLRCNNSDTSIYSYGSIDHIIMNDIDAHISIYNDKLEALAYNCYTGTEPSNIEGVANSKIYHYYHEVDTLAGLVNACEQEAYIKFADYIYNEDNSNSDKNISIASRVYINGYDNRFVTTQYGKLFSIDTSEDVIIKNLIMVSSNTSDDKHNSRGILTWEDDVNLTIDNVIFDIDGVGVYLGPKTNNSINISNSSFRGTSMIQITGSNNDVKVSNSSFNLYYSAVTNSHFGYIRYVYDGVLISNNNVEISDTTFATSYDSGASGNVIAICLFDRFSNHSSIPDNQYLSNVVKLDCDPITDTSYPDIVKYFTNDPSLVSDSKISSTNLVNVNITPHYYGE